jgi:hypothetical protein
MKSYAKCPKCGAHHHWRAKCIFESAGDKLDEGNSDGPVTERVAAATDESVPSTSAHASESVQKVRPQRADMVQCNYCGLVHNWKSPCRPPGVEGEENSKTVSGAQPSGRVCSSCGRSGHNRRTCPDLAKKGGSEEKGVPKAESEEEQDSADGSVDGNSQAIVHQRGAKSGAEQEGDSAASSDNEADGAEQKYTGHGSCSICGRAGHNKRTCPSATAVHPLPASDSAGRGGRGRRSQPAAMARESARDDSEEEEEEDPAEAPAPASRRRRRGPGVDGSPPRGGPRSRPAPPEEDGAEDGARSDGGAGGADEGWVAAAARAIRGQRDRAVAAIQEDARRAAARAAAEIDAEAERAVRRVRAEADAALAALRAPPP